MKGQVMINFKIFTYIYIGFAGPGFRLDSGQQPAGDTGQDEEVLPPPDGPPSDY